MPPLDRSVRSVLHSDRKLIITLSRDEPGPRLEIQSTRHGPDLRIMGTIAAAVDGRGLGAEIADARHATVALPEFERWSARGFYLIVRIGTYVDSWQFPAAAT